MNHIFSSFVDCFSQHLFGFCFDSCIHFIFIYIFSLNFVISTTKKKKIMIVESDEKIWQGKIWKLEYSILFSILCVAEMTQYFTLFTSSFIFTHFFFSFPFEQDFVGCSLAPQTNQSNMQTSWCRPIKMIYLLPKWKLPENNSSSSEFWNVDDVDVGIFFPRSFWIETLCIGTLQIFDEPSMLFISLSMKYFPCRIWRI